MSAPIGAPTPDERLAPYLDAPAYAERHGLIRAYLDEDGATMTRAEYLAACELADVDPRPAVLDALPEVDPLADRLAEALAAAKADEDALASPAPSTTAEGRPEDGEPGEKGERFGAAEVARFVTERYELGRSTDGKLIAVPRTGPRVSRTLDGMRATVAAAIFREVGRTPSPTTLATAFGVLNGIAAEADPIEVHLRAAYDSGARSLHIDLGDAEKTILRVDDSGWSRADGLTPAFRRTSATQPLPHPVADTLGTAREEFAELLGLAVESQTFRLVWGWLVAAWFPDMARPILWCRGEQGAGKTTRARALLSLVDPADQLGGAPGKNERDDATAAAGRFVPSFDNVRTISDAVSDYLCRLVTGVSIDRRALYSDDGLVTSTLRRTGLATSINLPYGLGPDAIERLIVVEFDRIAESDRAEERALDATLEALRPRLLGRLLDDVAATIGKLDAVRVERLPRMADYALTLHALDLARGGEHASAYLDAVDRALTDAVEDDPFLAAVVALAHRGALTAARGGPEGVLFDEDGRAVRTPGKAIAGGWAGTPGELVAAIEPALEGDGGKHPTSRGVHGVLKQKATPLRAAGVAIGERRGHGNVKVISCDSQPPTSRSRHNAPHTGPRSSILRDARPGVFVRSAAM